MQYVRYSYSYTFNQNLVLSPIFILFYLFLLIKYMKREKEKDKIIMCGRKYVLSLFESIQKSETVGNFRTFVYICVRETLL